MKEVTKWDSGINWHLFNIPRMVESYTVNSKLTIHYKDGTQYHLKYVSNFAITKLKNGNRLVEINGTRKEKRKITTGITENCNISYTLNIPAEFIDSLVWRNNSKISKSYKVVTL